MKCSKNHIVSGDVCGTCLERLRPEKVKVSTLKRTPLKKSNKPIPVMSEKYKKRNKAKMQTYNEIAEKEITWCESCGTTSKPLSRSHILPVGQYRQFEAVEENIIIECYGDSLSCHYKWENGTLDQKMKMETWERKVGVILRLAPSYLNLIMKNNKVL
jgi:hypothetical protein